MQTVHEGTLLSKVFSALVPERQQRLTHLLDQFLSAKSETVLNWNTNIHHSLSLAMSKIDTLLESQLQQILHHEQFSSLEGSWRGVAYLIKESQSSESSQIKIHHLTKQELHDDLDKAIDFDQSHLFKKVYEAEFGSPGGEPYGVLIGDYSFSHRVQDVSLLRNLSQVAAASFAPFITSAAPLLFGIDDWSSLAKPRDLTKLFQSDEYIKWRSFRQTDDSRFVCLTLPRVLARQPYSPETNPINAFNFNEMSNTPSFCWMNAAYCLGSKILHSFNQHGWISAIRGAENGGKVSHLPLYQFHSQQGELVTHCPCEVAITDRREAELSKCGFLPLSHYKKTDYAVFFGAQTLQQPKRYDTPEATANAAISARLPYVLASSRFAHYLKIMARDKVGSFTEAKDAQDWLNRWILGYVNGNPASSDALKAKYPLAEARIDVKATPGKPGCYHAIAWLRPWLQLEELTTSLRMVAALPRLSS